MFGVVMTPYDSSAIRASAFASAPTDEGKIGRVEVLSPEEHDNRQSTPISIWHRTPNVFIENTYQITRCDGLALDTRNSPVLLGST